MTVAERTDFADPALYVNRDLAHLEFDFRVLAQARDPAVPLLERLVFLCISRTNLDEFFETRVAVLKDRLELGERSRGPDDLPLDDVLGRIRRRTLELVESQFETWHEELLPALRAEGIRVSTAAEWTPPQAAWLRDHFRDEIVPLLSPIDLAPPRPFPRILNKSLNLVVTLHEHGATGRTSRLAVVRTPRSVPRIVRLPPEVATTPNDFVFLSALLQAFVGELFPGLEVDGAWQFRVTRNSELIIDGEEIENLALVLRDELKERGYAKPVRLEIDAECPPAVVQVLARNFRLADADVYRCRGPVNVSRANAIHAMVDRPDLKFAPFQPRVLPEVAERANLFRRIATRDVLLHHPYDSFGTVVELLRQAAADPDVLAIKQTLYRVGHDSPVIDHLVAAARAGKDVTVVVELRARFDEEANLGLADRLQEAGVQVVYGVIGYKTHAKMLLIVRREHGALRRYTHLSTGNYHRRTARLYTDVALLTADADTGADAQALFLQLSGFAPAVRLRRLLQSPFTMHHRIVELIDREIGHARAGRRARIVARMNALCEGSVIERLYRASNAGVPVDLIVRSACSLRPGLPGVSANIRVRSIVGRFLEHSRVWWFANDGDPELWCTSADWMERNLIRRVEVAFPVRDPGLAQRVFDETLANYLADNTQAWQLDSDGAYSRITPGDAPPHAAQETLLAALGID